MRVAASRGERILGALMIVAALAYLVHFVPRGWIPHDEGMLGQSAERVLQGGIPHIDYEEPYTGGLSWLYAAVFKISGVALLHVRWFLFMGASWAAWLIYAILRRYLRPIGAGLATWVALAWSFPNYFAGLPSWWLLICALACVWAVIRHVETAHWRYLVAAGLAVGLAMAIKQTGVYLCVALVLSLLYAGAGSKPVSPWFARVEDLVRWGAAGAAIVFAAGMLMPRIFRAEGLYLFVPAVACALMLLLPPGRDSEASTARGSSLTPVLIATAAAALPLACLLIPYAVRHGLWDFAYGSFILPRKRLAFASRNMPGALAIINGIPLLVLVFRTPRSGRALRSTMVGVLLWAALAVFALWNEASYRVIWESSRAFAALLPLAICWRLASSQVQPQGQRPVLYVSAAMLAWTSLNQYPYAVPIYFCYVAPLAVVAGVAAASAGSDGLPGGFRGDRLLPWAVMLLLFAVLSANRSYLGPLGVRHIPVWFDATLNLPRARLKTSGRDAYLYRRLVFSIERHLHGGRLIAGPDCPEVYFLSGQINQSRTLFDFFSENAAGGDEDDAVRSWQNGEVIVLNHAPEFSPAPSEKLSARLRREFPDGEAIGRFEIRWR